MFESCWRLVTDVRGEERFHRASCRNLAAEVGAHAVRRWLDADAA